MNFRVLIIISKLQYYNDFPFMITWSTLDDSWLLGINQFQVFINCLNKYVSLECDNWTSRKPQSVCNGVSINECYNAAKPFWREIVSFANNISSLIVAGTKIEFGEASRYTPLKPSLPHIT